MLDEKNRRILVIDDNHQIHEDFRKILAARNERAELVSLEAAVFGVEAKTVAREYYEIDSAYQGQEGFEKVRASVESQERYALAFVDMRMPPGWDGVQTIERSGKSIRTFRSSSAAHTPTIRGKTC
jgi:CheY-like chemotaxis protein